MKIIFFGIFELNWKEFDNWTHQLIFNFVIWVHVGCITMHIAHISILNSICIWRMCSIGFAIIYIEYVSISFFWRRTTYTFDFVLFLVSTNIYWIDWTTQNLKQINECVHIGESNSSRIESKSNRFATKCNNTQWNHFQW